MGGSSSDPATPAKATSAIAARACAEEPIDPTRHLRQLSLDLRGAPPSIDELNAVARGSDVPVAQVDAMLHAPQFLDRVRSWHKPLFWPNVDAFHIGVTELRTWDRLPNGNQIPVAPMTLILDGAAKHPHAVIAAAFAWAGDQRGESSSCDDEVEYPPPVERGAQPTYAVVGTDKKSRTYPFYDPRGIPLPYHTATDCPNFCSAKADADRSAHAYDPYVIFHAMDAAGADASPQELDPAGKHCPSGFPYRVVNACGLNLEHGKFGHVGTQREGFRWATPYWAHGARLKTCALDAQTRIASVLSGQSCAKGPDLSCGCGPDGVYCMPQRPTWDTPEQHALKTALDDEPLEIVADVVGRDDDYFETFTTRRSLVTGPLAFFFRHQSVDATPFEISPPAPLEMLPAIPYDDLAWHSYVRGPQHSGVLTTTEYLTRFPTRRSRIAQFRTEMMCRPITPIVDTTPGPDDPCTREPNLAKRCGCRNCHAVLEPMTAWFGRWSERSAKYLDPTHFPAFDPECKPCVFDGTECPPRCSEYVSNAVDADGARYAGTLRGYLYRTTEDAKRIDEGPRGLVDAAIASGELESCTVQTLWKQLVGRPMTDDETRARLPQLEADFEHNGRSYRALVKAIVTSPEGARTGGAGTDAPGRVPQRLSVEQLRASLIAATGFTWLAPHRVANPAAASGYEDRKDADMLEALAATLGRADYATTVSDALDPAIPFSKLSGDAARSACRASVEADAKAASADSRRILRFVSPGDTLASNATGVRQNLRYLALRFWGRSVADGADGDTELGPLEVLFDHASRASTPADGWRAVCIALATDPQFLTY